MCHCDSMSQSNDFSRRNVYCRDMALLQKLKSLFGAGGDGSARPSQDDGVTVETNESQKTGREAPPPMGGPGSEPAPSDHEDSDEQTDVTDEATTIDAGESTDDESTSTDDLGATSIADMIEEAEPHVTDEPADEAESDEEDGTEEPKLDDESEAETDEAESDDESALDEDTDEAEASDRDDESEPEDEAEEGAAAGSTASGSSETISRV